jgi:hypothetical protein
VGRTATVTREGEKEVFFSYFFLFSLYCHLRTALGPNSCIIIVGSTIVIGLGCLTREGANSISYVTIIIQLHVHLIILIPKV